MRQALDRKCGEKGEVSIPRSLLSWGLPSYLQGPGAIRCTTPRCTSLYFTTHRSLTLYHTVRKFTVKRATKILDKDASPVLSMRRCSFSRSRRSSSLLDLDVSFSPPKLQIHPHPFPSLSHPGAQRMDIGKCFGVEERPWSLSTVGRNGWCRCSVIVD